MFKQVTNSSFVRGSLVYTLISFGINIMNYLFNLVLARFFPLSVYGEYMTAMSYVVFFAVPFGAIATLLIKKIGERKQDGRVSYVLALEKWFKSNVESRFLLLLVVFLFITFLLYFKANLALNSAIFVVAMTIVSFATLLYSSALQAFKKFPVFGLATAVGTLFKICFGMLVVITLQNLSAVYSIIIFSLIIIYFIVKKAVFSSNNKQQLGDIGVGSTKILNLFYQKSFYLPLLSMIGMAGIMTSDLMLVKKLFEADLVGLYAGLSLLGKIILYGTMPVTAVAFSFFTGSESRGSRKLVLMASSMILLFVGLVASLFYGLFPEKIIMMVYGERFMMVAGLVPMIAVFGILYSFNYLFSHFYIAKNSYLALGSIVALLAQVVGIMIFHQNFYQVLMVGIVSLSGLLAVYLLGFLSIIFHNHKI